MPARAPLTVHSPSPGDTDLPSTLTYFAERRAAGYIGMFLPVIVVLYDRISMGCVPASISASYYTDTRNVFVGSLCAVGVFLVCSIGYEEDRWWSLLAGVLAVIVAFCPTSPSACKIDDSSGPAWTPPVHGIAACALFLVFTYFCVVLFTRTKSIAPGQPRRFLKGLPAPKKTRNGVYLVCGAVMFGAILVFVAYMARSKWWNIPPPTYLTLVVEWICLWTFGFAWLVKGQQMFKD